ncbi:uncharacterized protein MELLADRAFT_73072 [Melampsora larici-populina 98AG31]|uniref:Uncharacterized protein n=1 Tax=Melampsora larici-populina (strain 98AG31 / pathotype 3-4-7) TaxID=747676 RepID=F4S2W4_MELLP|nr:uncharacterized protein MELLADRAFT_73072 [Melampsora larici-populina 98AG31]EGG01121.1 hypothetical protein MELLADRAFT_73072 [Melampsora larici-populina 98AG31]
MQASFAKKEYCGGIHLTFNRTLDSKVTDTILEKGPSSLTNNEVKDWIDDIQMKRYTIIRVDKAAQAKSDVKVDINLAANEDEDVGMKANEDDETDGAT